MNPLDDIIDADDELEGMIFRAVEAFRSETTKPRSDPILPIPKETP